jgi:hypothetical protein
MDHCTAASYIALALTLPTPTALRCRKLASSFMGVPGVVSLSGGFPPADLFPFESISLTLRGPGGDHTVTIDDPSKVGALRLPQGLHGRPALRLEEGLGGWKICTYDTRDDCFTRGEPAPQPVNGHCEDSLVWVMDRQSSRAFVPSQKHQAGHPPAVLALEASFCSDQRPIQPACPDRAVQGCRSAPQLASQPTLFGPAKHLLGPFCPQMATAQQYNLALRGYAPLVRWAEQHVRQLHNPPGCHEVAISNGGNHTTEVSSHPFVFQVGCFMNRWSKMYCS